MDISLYAIGIISLIAYLEKNAVIWLAAGAVSMFVGFYWFDTYGTTLSLAISCCFFVYWLVCFSLAFKYLLARDDENAG